MATSNPWDQNWQNLTSLGEGGQGRTYKAIAKRDSTKTCVIKSLKNYPKPQARGRFVREASNLVTVYEAGGRVPKLLETNANIQALPDLRLPLYLAMEFIEGETLRQRVDRCRPLQLQVAIEIALDVCRTLHTAHGAGILHRDLKPENVIVKPGDDGPLAYLLDYGLSFNDETDDGLEITEANESFHNKFLLLPEHMFGRDQRDRRSDLTSVAGLLFYMLTQILPGPLRDEHGKMPNECARLI